MIAAILCIAALVACWAATRKSVALGLLALTGVGYAYGIVRANLLGGAVYFLFDCAVLGFFMGYRWRANRSEKHRAKGIGNWLYVLIGLPFAVALLPLQTPLVTLVGLRGNVFLLPFLHVGARLRKRDITTFAAGLAALNLLAFGMAALEYVKGVPAFYPRNAVTAIIYNSNDVAGGQYLRIPATFVTAHAFGGTMVATIPFLFAVWGNRSSSRFVQICMLTGIGLAAVGTLMSSVRISFVELVAIILAAVAWGKFGWRSRFALVAGIALIVAVSFTSDRLQRYKSLGETSVGNRIGGSVNRSFIEVLLQYPMGNGMGGGGTSIPAFLEGELRRPVYIESEFGRILLEQGVPGLVVWIAFIFWILGKWFSAPRGEWQYGKRLAFVKILFSFIIGLVGVGMLTSVPQTALLMLLIGWATAPAAAEDDDRPPLPAATPRVRARTAFIPAQI